MSIDPKELSSEERTWADAIAVALCASGNYGPDGAIHDAVKLGVEARRALFGGEREKEQRYKCDRCGESLGGNESHRVAFNTVDKAYREQISYRYTCELPLPAPAASELPEAVSLAAYHLRFDANAYDSRSRSEQIKTLADCASVNREVADDLEAWARKQEQEHRFQVRTLEAKYDNERVLRERDERSLSTASAGLPKVRALVDRARQAAHHLRPSYPEWSELLLRDSDAALAEPAEREGGEE